MKSGSSRTHLGSFDIIFQTSTTNSSSRTTAAPTGHAKSLNDTPTELCVSREKKEQSEQIAIVELALLTESTSCSWMRILLFHGPMTVSQRLQRTSKTILALSA